MEEKNNKGLIWLITILIVLVLGLIGYIIYDKTSLSNNKIENNTTTTTTTKKLEDNIDNSKYEKVSSFKLNLNGEEHNFYYKYFIIEGDSRFTNSEDIRVAKEEEIYAYYTLNVDIFIDNNKVKTIPVFYDTSNNKNQALNQIGNLNASNIKILEGEEGKDYLIYLIYEDAPMTDGRIIPFISNVDGEIIYEFDFELGGSMWVEDPTSKLYSQKDKGMGYQEYLIEKDKIYFLSYPDEFIESDYYMYLQENTLTINNDKAIIVKGNIYKGNGAGTM